MTLDDELVQTVDKVTRTLRTTRSAFTREALQKAIERISMLEREERHRQGYARKPVQRDEFAVWAKEQKWGDR